MKRTILLNFNENTKEMENEERDNFVRGILETLGLPLENIWDEEGTLTTDNKIKLRSILTNYNIQIIESGGEIKVYCDNQVIGDWRKPTYILKRDNNQLHPKKKLFLEMHIDCNSIFEESIT